MDAVLRYEIEDNIGTITLNRPEKLNAFTKEMIAQWHTALLDARANDNVRVIVLTGAGRGFCSGGDVSTMMSSAEMCPLEVKQYLQPIQDIPRCLRTIDKPVIAAINGVASGAGVDMALMCDIRFAATSAKLGMTYSRVGLLPGPGGAYFLPRLVGSAKALEMFWSSELVGAQEALSIGLVNRVYADEELLAKTYEFARRVAGLPPLSIRLLKRAVYQSLEVDLETSLDMISSHMTIVRTSSDHREAVAALREQRQGSYLGR